MVSPDIYHIGYSYGLKQGDKYFRVTLTAIDESVEPPQAHVIIREHSVDSFLNGSSARKRHKNRGEAIPCATVPLTDLFALTEKRPDVAS